MRLGDIRDRIAGFGQDRSGNFAMIFALASTMLALAVGFAVDTAQLMNARSALQSAVDAAVTSTARDLTTGNATEEEARERVMTFLAANSAGGILARDSIVLDRLVIDRTARTVTASAYVDVPLYFPLFGRSNVKRIHNEGAALYSDKRIEVVMMLDVTGSMKANTRNRTNKIKDLRDASAAAVNIFLDMNAASNGRVRLGLVPYSEGVNTGVLAHTVFHEADDSIGSADAPPSLNAPRGVAAKDNCSTERKNVTGNGIDYSDAGPVTAMVNRDDRLVLCPAAALVPMTTDRSRLLAAIDGFRADGGTAGHIGVQWTRYLLSPSWRSTLEAAQPGSGPLNYNDNQAKKIAVLMTDGEFNAGYAGVRAHGSTRSGQEALSTNAALEHCKRMKENGIEIFTVGFMLEDKYLGLMQSCATPDAGGIRHFYRAANGDELKAAFEEIAGNAEKLILTR